MAALIDTNILVAYLFKRENKHEIVQRTLAETERRSW